MNKSKVWRFIFAICIVFSLFGLNLYASVQHKTVVYFYSSTCSSCKEVSKYLDEYLKDKDDIQFVKYDILKEN